MEERKFKQGDVVHLRSGGPKMTVNGYNAHGACVCLWFAGTSTGCSQVEVYDDALMLIEGPLDLSTQGDIQSALDVLIREAGRIEREHGFGNQTFGEDIALIHSELSEALEDFRANRRPNEMWFDPKEPLDKPCGIPSELADVVIRILGVCHRHNIDLATAVRLKMDYNESRPFKHGGKAL